MVSEASFKDRLTQIMEENLGNESFGVSELSEQMNLSRSQLHRKIQQATGKKTTQFIREFRLEKAKELLSKTNLSSAEIGYRCGFRSSTYFSSTFTDYFKVAPGKFRQSLLDTQESKAKKKTRKPTLLSIQLGIVLVTVCIIIWFVQNQKASSHVMEHLPGTQENSIVVMPLSNLNLSEDEKYLCTGVFGAICSRLSSIEYLRIIPSTNGKITKGMSFDDIRKTANASKFLSGDLQRHGDMVRINVNLFDLNNGDLIWAETFDRKFADLLSMQSEIAERIAVALKVNLTQDEQAQIHIQETKNAEAYDLYLKGSYEWHTYTQQGTNAALEYFNKAIALDSNFALAYSGIALCYIGKAAIFGVEMSALEGLSLSKIYIDKALSIKPYQSLALMSNGFYYLYHDWDFKKAEEEYLKGIQSKDADALAVYVDLLHFTHRHDEALEKAMIMDHYNPYFPNSRMLLSLYYSGKYEEARKYAENRLRYFNNYFTLDNYGFFMLNTGDYQEAIKYFNKVLEIEGVRYPRILGWMGAAYAGLGKLDEANTIIKELEMKRKKSFAGSPAFFLAVVHSALGERDQALYWLSDAIENHEMEIPWLISEPQLYPLHSDSTYQALVEEVGFPRVSIDLAQNLLSVQQ